MPVRRFVFGLLVLLIVPAPAQEMPDRVLRNFRIDGTLDARFPVALPTSHPVTVSFDLDAPHPAEYHLRILHCDRNWAPTRNVFVNDPSREIVETALPYTFAPIEAHGFRFTYAFRLPGLPGVESFAWSGNYRVDILDHETGRVVASGKFFVADSLLPNAMHATNRLLPSSVSPWNQVHSVSVTYTVPKPEAGEIVPFNALFLRTADIYRNRELGRKFRIDLDDDNPETFIDGWGTNVLRFRDDDVPPGNEYRVLDIRNRDLYPSGETIRPRDGADISRWLTHAHPDHNGISTFVSDGPGAEYVDLQLELLLPDGTGATSVSVVGDFNGWTPDSAWTMTRNPADDRWIVHHAVRRGIYDYQYVMNGDDWVTLEGTGWGTVNVYTAFLYYSDPRFGGFDRIIGFAQGRSPKTLEAAER